MHLASHFVHVVDSINYYTGKYVSYFVLAFVILIGYEVLMRYAFKSPSIWAEEAAIMAHGIYFMLGGVYTLLHNKHINVDVLSRNWSPRTKAIIDCFTSVMFFFFIILLLWKGGEMALHSIEKLEHSMSVWRPIIYPVKSVVPLAAFLMLLQGIAQFIRNLTLGITGRELQ
jgi:TRAP-type mannitol/chloroaromatic compound transport system permease small subunit